MIIIAEKINGFIPATKKAIEAHDEEYIRYLAREQTRYRADYIDVCAGTDAAIEMETMEWLLKIVQEETDVPIAIDSSDPQIIVDCIPLVKKEGMINSVSMEEGKIETIFPVIADTKWNCVALTCDQEGIPDDPPTKLKITREIMAAADEYGIAHDRIYIDPLVTTLGTKQESFLNFSEGIRLIHEEFPQVHFTSGLSNISFAMPFRRGINCQFLCLAMNAGMDSAIMDPLDEYMQASIYATDALLGNDFYCMEYIGAYNDGIFPKKPED